MFPEGKRCYIFIILLLCSLSFFASYWIHTNTKVATNKRICIAGWCLGYTKPLFVMGILSKVEYRNRRDAMRSTWLRDLKRLEHDIPYTVIYKFLVDNDTIQSEKENRIYNDIISIHSKHSGYSVLFGEKQYNWFRYAAKQFPDFSLMARIDDDVYACVPEIFNRIFTFHTPRLYYGWYFGNNTKVSRLDNVDDMFSVFGRELIQRIVYRKLCKPGEKCDPKKDLVDNNNGGASIAGSWLSIYRDVDIRADNDKIVHHYGKKNWDNPIHTAKYGRPGFCKEHFICHKANPHLMRLLYRTNRHNYNMSSQVSKTT